MLNTEFQDKYTNLYSCEFKASLELESNPICFNYCIKDMQGGGLTSDEKNCMRECFLKRVASRDDFMMLAV